MSLNEEERQLIVSLEFEKSIEMSLQFQVLAQLKLWDTLANRIYYALFHAFSAMLIADGHQFNTHRGIVALIGQHYVLTEVLSQNEAKFYSRLQSLRELADYNASYKLSEEEVTSLITPAEELLETIRQYLLNRNFLQNK